MRRILAGGGEIAGRCRGGETCGFRRQMTAAALFPVGCLTPERGYAWGDVGETDSVASVLRGELPKNDNRYWRLAVSERRAAPLASQQANTFSLSGGYIHVDFSTTSINGQPRLIYQDPVRNLSFAGSDIRRVDVPDIGSIVSVTLDITVDVGSTTFSVFIPNVIVPVGPGGSTPVTTEGVTTIHRTPFVPQLPGQREVYSVVQLTGVATHLEF